MIIRLIPYERHSGALFCKQSFALSGVDGEQDRSLVKSDCLKKGLREGVRTVYLIVSTA